MSGNGTSIHVAAFETLRRFAPPGEEDHESLASEIERERRLGFHEDTRGVSEKHRAARLLYERSLWAIRVTRLS